MEHTDDTPEVNFNGLLQTRPALTPREAAACYGCSVELIYKRIRNGDLDAIRLGGKRLAIPTAAIRNELGVVEHV